ncbi:MAG: ABC transporter ATP-binding protein [Halobacteriales archaeon]
MVDIALTGVRKEFGTETVALEGIDLDINDGEFFTLVGPSGCGKTTTLRIIAGLEAPTSGRVHFGDRDVSGVPTEDRDVGIVFQNYALFPHMTVGENVAYGLQFRDPPGDVSTDERVANLLELVDLGGMQDRDPDALSGGQQQRVALARALAPGPQLLLLDEPMSALDARLREQLRRQVKQIQNELEITTVYVTHDQAEALAISDRVAVMNDGAIEQVGDPRTIYRTPATRFVAEFIGDNNLFEGQVQANDDDGLAIAVDGGRGTGTTTFRIAGDRPVGETVTFCVRPEAMTVGGTETNRIDVDPQTVEFLGEATRVYADWNGTSIVLRTDEQPRDDRLTVGFEPTAAVLL